MDILDQIVDALKKRNLIRSGQVEYAKTINRSEPVGQEISLTTLRTPELGNGIRIGAHQSLRTFGGTDETVNITVVYDEEISGKKQDILYDNDSYESDEMFSGATIYNTAQSGKVLSFRAYRDMKFKNGSTKFRGTVSLNLSSVRATTSPALTGGVADLILAANTSRKKATIQNNTPATVYLGEAGIDDAGANKGLELLPGATATDDCTGAIYCYSAAARAAGLLTVVSYT